MGKIEKENGKGDLMANKIKRMSQKEYTIHKMYLKNSKNQNMFKR
jgi:hypothetical protein